MMDDDHDYCDDDGEGLDCNDSVGFAEAGRQAMENAMASSHEVKWYRLEVRSECDAEIPVAFTYVQAWDEKMAACMGDFFVVGYHVVSVDECESPLEASCAAKEEVAKLEELIRYQAHQRDFEQKKAGELVAQMTTRISTLRDGVFALNRGQAAQTQVLAQMLDAVK